MKLIDLTGQRFGRLTVIERVKNKNDKVYWRCQCDCGEETVVSSSNLRGGKIKSCGCLNLEKITARNTTHGMKHTSIYNVWCGIKDRCFNPNHKYYEYYGGRGITICDEWRDSFQAFYDYVSKLEHFDEDGYSIDRIDNNGNYAPNNVRWADRKTQGYNKRNNIIVDYMGKKISLAQAEKITKIPVKTLRCRYQSGDRGEKLFRPVSHKIHNP